MICVPIFPAVGFGSADVPAFAGIIAPSEYCALLLLTTTPCGSAGNIPPRSGVVDSLGSHC